jgi:hypothetical protein
MSIKTIGRIVEGCVAAIFGGSAHLAADHNVVANLQKLWSNPLLLYRHTDHLTYSGFSTR